MFFFFKKKSSKQILILSQDPLTANDSGEILSKKPHGYEVIDTISGFRKEKIDTYLPRILDELWIIAPRMSKEEILATVFKIKRENLIVRIYPDIFKFKKRLKLDGNFTLLPAMDFSRIHLTPWQKGIKRAIDLFFSSFLLLLTLPLWFIIWIAIRLDSKGGAIFRQKRIGFNGATFFLYKFRTMRYDVNPFASPPKNLSDPRITGIGRFLRRTSLDELPQLINIIKGEMSLVGPRPEMPFIVNKYKPWQRKRLEVKPGLTGLWQVVGRKDLPLHQNLEYDFYYITNQSLLFDMIILLKTVIHVIRGEGAY